MNIHFYDSTQLAYAKITVCSDYDDHEDTWTWLAKALRVKQFYVLIDRFDFALKSLHDKDNYDWFFRRSCFVRLVIIHIHSLFRVDAAAKILHSRSMQDEK